MVEAMSEQERYETRVAHGTLTSEQLLEGMRQKKEDDDRTVLAELMARSGVELPESETLA